MKKNIYYRGAARRTNVIRSFILVLFLIFCSYPRLFLEVFIRRNFGERYFNIASVVTGTIILFALPFWFDPMGSYRTEWHGIILNNVSWYLFTLAFLLFGILRWIEILRTPGVFDFERYSLSQGVPHLPIMRFWDFVFGRVVNPRILEIYLEPLPAFVAGVLIMSFYPPLGFFLIICSVFYSISYMGQYWQGDETMMDMIDEIIANEQTESIIVGDLPPSETKGTRFYFTKPKNPDARRRIADNVIQGDEDEEPAAAIF